MRRALENAMRDRFRFVSLMLAALISGSAFTGLFLLTSTPRAQTDAPRLTPPVGSIPASEVPFHAQWAASPHARFDDEAFKHWDKEGAIPLACARCHSTPGFLDYLGADGSAPSVIDRPAAVGSVITCNACHNPQARQLGSVVFPSGAWIGDLGAEARCMACHQGTESGASVERAVATLNADAVEPKLGFVNVHYRAAGATLYGAMAHGGYQYPSKNYGGRYRHPVPFNRCTTCHEPHSTEVNVQECAACHRNTNDKAALRRIRFSKSDFDGDGDTREGIAHEVEHLHARLMAAIMEYAKAIARKPIVYDAHAFPYFFVDTNGDGVADKEEARVPNRYNAWTPRLLKAAYNYQLVAKDPGAYAHNPVYTLQILYDSLADLGARVSVDLASSRRP
jgi:hypothetical protein